MSVPDRLKSYSAAADAMSEKGVSHVLTERESPLMLEVSMLGSLRE